MDFKQVNHEIKGIDEKDGIVIAYANAYGNEDSDGDISGKGAFTKTAKENFKRIRVLKDHNSTISLGVPLEIDTKDSFGLLTKTQFNLKKEVSRDMFTDIQLYKENGLNAELSIGYGIVSRNEKDSRVIDEYKLYEYSFLTSWAANELATVQGVKNFKTTEGMIDLITKAYDLNYSDTRLKAIEAALKTLTKEPSNDTLRTEPSNFMQFLK